MPIPLDNALTSMYIDDLLENEEYPLLDRIVGFLNHNVRIQYIKSYFQRKKDGDCRDYAFEFLGLPQYKYIGRREDHDNVDLTRKLRNDEIPELAKTESFAKGVLVAYYCKGKYGEYFMHYGVCVGFDGGIPVVESLWGKSSHVMRHHVGSVASFHGDHVELFKKKTS